MLLCYPPFNLGGHQFIRSVLGGQLFNYRIDYISMNYSPGLELLLGLYGMLLGLPALIRVRSGRS